jgi:hypothetical protein
VLENLSIVERNKIGREVFYKINSQDAAVQSIIHSVLEVNQTDHQQ